MRTFLLNMALTGALTLASGALAAPYLGAGPVDAAWATGMDSSAVLVQKRSLRRGSVNRSLRVRPRIGSRFKRRPYLNNPSRSARPSRVIRSRSGVLRDRYNRGVRSGSGSSGGGRDIGAGQAVISAQARVPGTVLGVRRNGSVYNVKILDRNRVRIISVNAATGQVMR